jgi:hypothetical protein
MKKVTEIVSQGSNGPLTPPAIPPAGNLRALGAK